MDICLQQAATLQITVLFLSQTPFEQFSRKSPHVPKFLKGRQQHFGPDI